MKKIRIITAGIVGLVGVLVIYFVYHPLVYCTNYYSSLGLGHSWLYNDIIYSIGYPVLETYDVSGQILMNYDGFTIVHSNKKNGIMESVRITGNQYRFGYFQIGVGTSKKQLQRIYKHIKKIKDLPKNEFGVIENNTWIWFEFDESNCVSKMTLTLGL